MDGYRTLPIELQTGYLVDRRAIRLVDYSQIRGIAVSSMEVPDLFSLARRTAVVTGGAGGLGRMIADHSSRGAPAHGILRESSM
jgi:hypothetical protein